MLIKRFEDAQPYEAPNHWGVHGLRLQGFEEAGPPISGWATPSSCRAAARDRTPRPSRRSM